MRLLPKAAPAHRAGAAVEGCVRDSEDIIRGVLRLRGSVNQELAIVANYNQPAA